DNPGSPEQTSREGVSEKAGSEEETNEFGAGSLAVESTSEPNPLRAAELAGIDLPGLQIQQAQRQSEKSADEVLGVAAAFRAIREELVNNRVDAEDRQSRLENLIAAPLQRIGGTMFPELDARLKELEKSRENRSEQVA